MYATVNGPYIDKRDNTKHVSIIYRDKDGFMLKNTTLAYGKYLKELEQGLHQYKKYEYIPSIKTKKEKYERRLSYFNNVKEEYNLPLITEDNKEQFYYPNAYEIETMPGYYYIPIEGSVYAINKEGIIIRIDCKKVLKQTKKNTGYYDINLCFYSKLDNYRKHVSQHRMLALLFIPRPDRHLYKDYNQLDVNHKDGIKTNNNLVNLEWVTHVENNDHAIINGLNNSMIKSTPILAKNIITGKIKYYYSLSECAKEFDIAKSTFRNHLNSTNYGLVSVNNYIFKYDNDTAWPDRPPISKNNKGYFKTTTDTIVKNIMTGEIFIFKSMIDAFDKLQITSKSVYKHFKKYGKDQPYKNYLFYNLLDFKIKKY